MAEKSRRRRRRRGQTFLLIPVVSAAVVLLIGGAAYACTNFVGVMKVIGNRADSETATVTGSQSFGETSEAMTQSVSAGVAKADSGLTSTARWFKVWTGAASNGWQLATATYDVNWINVGYSTHTQWANPTGDCMSWTVPSTAANLGTVHITNGTIDGAAGTYNLGYASNWAQFKMPNSVANTGTQEAGVCVSDQVGSHNGNQAPLKLI